MKIRIGTRKSRLALIQTEMVTNALREIYSDCEIEIVYITTTGDKRLDKSLIEIGGKGVFVSEIEQALQREIIDIAVHSAKDLPVILGSGLIISAVLKRGNYRDVLVTKKGTVIEDNSDLVIGTSSMRRQCNLRRLYPKIRFSDIRGNVDTRLNKLKNGSYNGIILAAAGLERIGLNHIDELDYRYFDYEEFLPAPCQGIIAIESRESDDLNEYLKYINDEETYNCFETERSIVRQCNADCTIPLGAYSFIQGEEIHIAFSENMEEIKQISGKIEQRFSLVKELTAWR